LVSRNTERQLYFLATFPDPNHLEAPRGGYRRNVSMLRLLATHFNPTLVVMASHAFQVDAGKEVVSVIIDASRLPVRWVKSFRFLKKHCSPETPIVIYNPTLHSLPALWLRWLKYTVIVDYVDIQGTVVESTNFLLRKVGVLVERLFIRACRQFITSSTAIQKRIHTLNPTAKVLLYRGTFQSPEDWEQNMPEIELPSDVIKIMYLGMLQDFSGVRELLHAYIDLNPPNAYLYIVGHGPVKQECIRLADKFAPGKVFFPELDDAHLHPFMQQMDLLTVPYLDAPRNQANFPSKIIEYLWAGKAILGTQVGEIQHVLDNKRTALLVPPTEAGLRAGLQQMLGDQLLRERLGQNARHEFEERYNPSIVSEALCAFVADAVSGG
jgi:glycosyltransferase involved in cell wall biosynthesis